MDYSPLLSQIEHPLLLDLDLDEVDNIGHDFQKIKLDDGEDLSFNLESILSPNSTTTVKSGFFRRSKSKTEELGSPSKISSPIEIKGSPGHHKSISTTNNINNKEKEHQQGSHSSSGSGSRMSFFKVLTRRNSSANQGKHKKMTDKWLEGSGEPVMDGVAFCVKFLGSTLIENAGAVDAAEATKTVIQMTKAGHKPTRLGLTVSTNGITLSDPSTGEVRLEISIYDIAHCSADSSHPNVFSFIATNKNDVNECYCFATRKRKMAHHITLTIAQAFNLAFELWQNSSLDNCGGSSVSSTDAVQVIVGSTDSNQSNASTGSDIRDWVAFDQDKDNHQEEQFGNRFSHAINLVTLSPFHRPNPSRRLRQPPKNAGDDLLICLN